MRREVIAFLGALASRWITHLSTRCVFVHTALVFPHQNTERCLLFVLLTLMCFKNTKMDHSVLQGPLFARFLSLLLCLPLLLTFAEMSIFYMNMNSFNQLFTVVLKRKSKWHHLWSKLPISDLVFYNIKLPPCSGSLGSTLQLTGALKRGTVWTSSSTGIGIMKGRSWTLVFY